MRGGGQGPRPTMPAAQLAVELDDRRLVASVVASVLGAIFIPKDRQRPQGPPPSIKVVN